MNPVHLISSRLYAVYRFFKVYGQHLPMATKAIFSVSCKLLMIRGITRNSGTSLVLLYVGRRWNDKFLVDLLFDRHEIISEKDVSLFAVHSRSRCLESEADIQIVDIGWPYDRLFKRHGSYLEFADWINMTLPLEEDWDSVVRSFRSTTRNNDLRLIRRNQYRLEVTDDPATIETFYDEMYLPSVSHRHGTASIVAPKRHVLKRARQGKLLQIYRGEQVVIAGVVYPEDDVLYFLWQGSPPVFQGNSPEGAVSALYFFGIRYAFDNKLDEVDFAGTRAFLDFGDFRFKRKWGAVVDDSFSPNSLLLKPLNNSENTISFCEQFPLIARCDEGLEAVIVRRDETVNTDTFKRLEKLYNCGGLVRVVIISVSDESAAPTTTHEYAGREFQVIQCGRKQFSGRYVSRTPVAH
jgi:hypothetical protein